MDGRQSKSVTVWSPHHSRLHSKSYQPPTRSKASGKKRHASKQNNDETNNNNDNTATAAAAASTNANWGGSGSTNSPLLSSKTTTIENYNNTHSSNNISVVPHTSNNNTKLDNGLSSPSTPKRTKLNNTITSAGDENNNLSNTPEKGELRQQPKNGIVASNNRQQEADGFSLRKTRSSTVSENSSTVSDETIIHDTERAKAANVVSFFAQLTSLQEVLTATDEGGVSGNGADDSAEYFMKRFLGIDEIKSTDCYNQEECSQQAAVEIVNKSYPIRYLSCIMCLINNCGGGLEENECEGMTLSTVHRREIVENCNDGVDVDFPSTILYSSTSDDEANCLEEFPIEARKRRLQLALLSGMASDKPPPSSGALPQMTAKDIPTDAFLKKANRPDRKPDPKTKGQRGAAARYDYELRSGEERQNELYALRNAVQSSLWPNITSESFELVSTEEYNEGYNDDPDFFKKNAYLRCLVCRQLIKTHETTKDINLTNANTHAGPCAELKRTGKIDDQGQCACRATKDHPEFKGKQAHAFIHHAQGCHGTHCTKCGKDFDNWTSNKCKQPKVLSFVERRMHVNDKKLKAHKEWEEEQKKRD